MKNDRLLRSPDRAEYHLRLRQLGQLKEKYKIDLTTYIIAEGR